MRRAASTKVGVTLATLVLAGCGSSSGNQAKNVSHQAAGSKANAADRAFAAEMIPDDQLAVQLAKLAPTRAMHAQLKTFAAHVVSADNAQIAQLTAIASSLGVKPAPMNPTMMTGMQNDAVALGLQMYQLGMDQVNASHLAGARAFDTAFLQTMITHHKGALNMARGELSRGTNSQLKAVANVIASGDQSDLSQLEGWEKAWSAMSGAKKSSGGAGMSGMSGMGGGSKKKG